uniref:Uncharacterized protein n=1 Tax=Hyaloperonospora arabidopsidis (strain Emoy2) TaxID=559515 RepID=M4BQA2_HYAAE
MEESVDYGSNTSIAGDARTMSDTPMSEVRPPTTLSPFAERDEVIVTNPLDEQQQLAVQREESARRHAQMVTTLRNQRDYVFNPPSVEERLRQTTGQSLATWTIGPVAASTEEGASGQALRERYLEPSLTTQSQYVRLELQARGAPVPPIKGVPILLSAGETKEEEDNELIRWMHRTRRLSSMYAMRASVSVADVRLKRKLRYDYSKLKARGQLRNCTRYSSATTVAAGAGQTVTNNPPIPPLVVGNGLSLNMTLATMFKKIHGVWAACQRGISYSHEFSDSGYRRHFTRYCYWPWRRRRFRSISTWNWRFPFSSNSVGGGRCTEGGS